MSGLDRRAFIARMSWGAAIAGALPVLAWAVPRREPLLGASEEDWHVDDMWGHRPRYAHAVPHAASACAPIAWEHVAPIDAAFVG